MHSSTRLDSSVDGLIMSHLTLLSSALVKIVAVTSMTTWRQLFVIMTLTTVVG
jgi:hypothetical protein